MIERHRRKNYKKRVGYMDFAVKVNKWKRFPKDPKEKKEESEEMELGRTGTRVLPWVVWF